MASAEVFDSFFRRADLDRDGRISGGEAVGFFQGSGLPQATLAKIWQFSDQKRAGFLSRQEFINALKLVTVAQTGRDLTPELVKAALNGPVASQIPPPRINPPAPPAANFGQAPPARPPASAIQGNYGQQFSAPSVHGQQLGSQGAFGPTSQFASLGTGMPPASQAQGRFSSVGSTHQGSQTMQPSPRPGFSTAGAGVPPGRPTLGGLMGTSSLPSVSQFSGGVGLSAGPGFQPTSASGLPRPTAPSSLLYSGPSLSTAMSTPASQAGGTGGLKLGPGSVSTGHLYGAAFPTGTGAPSKSKSTSELQGFGDSFSVDPVGPKALAPTTLSSSSGLASKSSGVSVPSDLGAGYGSQLLSGPGVSPPWPRMNATDVQRYTRVFSQVDTDHDGKITGEQARHLFLSWQLPKDVLKQVWNLSDQDGDSMLSVREFCTALYLMERFREGRPLPPRLPPGIHLDDPRDPDGQMPAGPRQGYGASNWPQQGNMQHLSSGPGPGPIRPTLLTTPAGQQNLHNLTSGNRDAADAFGEFNFLNKKKQPAKEVSSSMPAPNALSSGLAASLPNGTVGRKMMDHREKSAYYRTKLQEIVLFKSRCDNKLSEITERAAADKREVESLAKKYDEKFKSAAEVNAQLALENASVKDAQEKKMELLDALFKMEHGGNPNALLQKRSDHIATDVDKLKMALRERGRLLGVVVKQKIPKEMPFGWMQNLEEKAAAWVAWDELVDKDFSAVHNMTDEIPSTDKPSGAASWGKEEDDSLGNGSAPAARVGTEVSAVNGDLDVHQEAPSTPERAPDVALENDREAPARAGAIDVSSSKPSSDVKSGVSSSVPTPKAVDRYANVADSQEFGSDAFNGSTAASSPTSSSEVGRGSLTPEAFSGLGSSWGLGLTEDDGESGSRASWNPPSTQASLHATSAARGATRLSKSSGSFDSGSPRPSSVDGNSSPGRAFERNGTHSSHDFDSFGPSGRSRDSNKPSSLFGGHSSPKASAPPSLFGGSPKASKRDDGFDGSFLRFDSFGPGSPVAPARASGTSEDRPSSFFSRFDSFASVQTDGARGSGFHSDDESDIFRASGPFGAKQ